MAQQRISGARDTAYRAILPEGGESTQKASPGAPHLRSIRAMRLTDLPGDVVAVIFDRLRLASSPRAFAMDVRRFALVSRATQTLVDAYTGSEAGRALTGEWAARAEAFEAQRLERALHAAADQPSRRKLPLVGGKGPPKALKELVRQTGIISLTLPCNGEARSLFDALVRWGRDLPVTGLKITADPSAASARASQKQQHVNHLTMLITLLKALADHPHRERICIDLHVTGSGSFSATDPLFTAHADTLYWQFFQMLAVSDLVIALRLDNVFLWNRLCPNLWKMTSLQSLHITHPLPLRDDDVNELLDGIGNAQSVVRLTLGPLGEKESTRARLQSLRSAKPELAIDIIGGWD